VQAFWIVAGVAPTHVCRRYSSAAATPQGPGSSDYITAHNGPQNCIW